MTVFSMRFFRKVRLLLAAWLFASAWLSCAEGISVHSAEVSAMDDGYYLSADFDLDLTPSLEEALTHGVPLTFLLSFDIIQPRWYWFDRTIVDIQQERRLSYNPLTRVYRFSIGSLYLNFNSLDEALQALKRFNRTRIADLSRMKKGENYEARLQLKLDVSRLPKPFQVDAISSNDWKLVTKPQAWKISP
jgi:hypothetical protein